MAMRSIFAVLLLMLSGAALALQSGGLSAPDPFIITDTFQLWNNTPLTGTSRLPTINPAVRTLVLITDGQSNRVNAVPNFFSPVNDAHLDNFSAASGGTFQVAANIQGCTTGPGVSSVSVYEADALLSSGNWDRVIMVPIGVSTTLMSDHAGPIFDRFAVAMKRLASRGIVPGMTGVTFALEIGLGESDGLAGTSQAAWMAAFASYKTQVLATGFNGRIFLATETWFGGVTYPVIQAAQAAVVDNVRVFPSGNLDTLGATNRQADNTHFNNVGAAASGALIAAAMHASGAPF